MNHQPFPEPMIHCLSSTDYGSCLSIVDLQKPNKPEVHRFDGQIFKAFDRYDEYGGLFCLSSIDGIHFYDRRTKNTEVMSRITAATESKFNVIYNIFADGRTINVATIHNILVYDLRNPGNCVLKFKHFCEVPPNKNTFAQSLDNEYSKESIEFLMGDDFDRFEDSLDQVFQNSTSTTNKSLQKAVCLYSCRKNSFPILMTNYEPLDKAEVVNRFNYDLIREINQSIDPNRLFNQLTRSDVHPQRMFSSNVYNSDLLTNGVSCVYINNKLYYFQVDSKDQLAMQIVSQKPSSSELYGFEPLKKQAMNEPCEFVNNKALVSFKESELRNNIGKATWNEVLEDIDSNANNGSGSNSSSGELDTLSNKSGEHLQLEDLRKDVEAFIDDRPLKFDSESQKTDFDAYMQLGRVAMDEEEAQEGSPPGEEEDKLPKHLIEKAKELANERFFITKQCLNFLNNNY